jgi:hypothetical protein
MRALERLKLGAASACVLLGACQAQAPTSPRAPPPHTGPSGPGTLPHTVLHAGTQCGADTALVERIVDAGGLRQAIAGRGVAVGSSSAMPAADFDRSLVLRLSMGQQPNPGHRMGVTGAQVESGASRRLVIHTVWATPEPGRMYAAVVTQPCVIVAVPRGDFTSVVVLDAQRRERASATLAP